MTVITVERKVLEKNDEVAEELRSIFQKNKTIVLNLLGSPGCGKTTLLEKTLKQIKGDIVVAVIEGDVQTDNDARRIARFNIPVVQIITNGGCHLDAMLVRDALENLPLEGVQQLFIENVGNLVCPANYDLGENKKVIILSTAEGDDKPLKYPIIFRAADVCILNKIDLLPYVDFDISTFHTNARKVNPKLKFIELSATTGDGLQDWIDWLKKQIK
jgi:hydrogenase nickel incorporation protein HypB